MTTTNSGDTLTPKMAAFSSLVASGRSQVDAYIEAYSVTPGGSRNAARNEASKLALKPKVQARIKHLREGRKSVQADQEALSHQWILDNLRAEAVNTANAPSVRVRALEIIAKSQGLFSDASSVTVEARSSSEIERDLKERLNSLLGTTDIALVE
jgi:hypothetical protein|tara:strand:+ start:118 stop:582 length:465 start_codon:yes stop_codon:yes gene_type:complete